MSRKFLTNLKTCYPQNFSKETITVTNSSQLSPDIWGTSLTHRKP